MRNLIVMFMAGLFSLPVMTVQANNFVPDYIAQSIPEAMIVGEGRMTYMMMDIYDARLYAPQGQFQRDQPLALSLTYLRPLRGIRIADRSIEEMRKQGFFDEVALARWHTAMRQIFPDVSNGTTLTGILTDNGETIFYHDGRRIGHIKDSEFGIRFFSIWLSPETSQAGLRDNLLRVAEQGYVK